MTLRYIALFIVTAFLTALSAQEHTRILDLPLDLPASEMVEKLADKGLEQEERYELSGSVAGLDAWFYVNVAKDSSRINYILLTTQEQQGASLSDDFNALKKWMQKHYGAPNWEGAVRSHPFARWWVGLDRDIVMISTASTGIEIWFYDNHQIRNIDYYAILKYCERHPAPGVPHLTAQEQVTWKSSTPPSASKKKWSKRKHRRGRVGKGKNYRRQPSRKARKRRRR